MKLFRNFFLSNIILFSIFFNSNAISDEVRKKTVEKKVEGINFPVQILKNEFISKKSIFVLEHRPGAIIEIQKKLTHGKNPKHGDQGGRDNQCQ